MRKSVDLDHMLENAVAEALGLDRPHPQIPRKLRGHAKVQRRQNASHQRREHTRVAA